MFRHVIPRVFLHENVIKERTCINPLVHWRCLDPCFKVLIGLSFIGASATKSFARSRFSGMGCLKIF